MSMAARPELLAAGRELDLEVENAGADLGLWGDGLFGYDGPGWSTDPVLATRLLDRLRDRGYWVSINTPGLPGDALDWRWEATIDAPKDASGARSWESDGLGETWMVALCRALVRTQEPDPPERSEGDPPERSEG
jgi:hypothetical protein